MRQVAVLPIVEPANRNDRYDERLNGRPVTMRWRDLYPVVLDPDVGRELAVACGRPSLLDLVREARPRIARMGHDAIAECHAAGHPAWVEGDDGRVWRLDPDGTRHVETRPAGEVLAAVRDTMPPI